MKASQEDANFQWLHVAVSQGGYPPRAKSGRAHGRSKLTTMVRKFGKNIQWRPSRHMLWCSYKQNGKIRTLSKTVHECSDTDRNTKVLQREAVKLQHLRDSMHEGADTEDEADDEEADMSSMES